VFNNGQELTTETEFNIVAHPKSEHGRVPVGLSLNEYLSGGDQTKLIGNLRLHVACDDPIAVAAGREVFGEPKFITTFDYNIPGVNVASQQTWHWRCNDPQDKSLFIFDLEMQQLTAPATWVNPSPITGYTYLVGRGVGSRWNPLTPAQQFMLQPSQSTITFGASDHPMRADMQSIIGTTPAVAVQVSVSPPVCIESGPYYVNP
jgi:hypothetical protein